MEDTGFNPRMVYRQKFFMRKHYGEKERTEEAADKTSAIAEDSVSLLWSIRQKHRTP